VLAHEAMVSATAHNSADAIFFQIL